MVQRLIPHVFSAIVYFMKSKAGYSACSMLHVKERHGFGKSCN
jgi:hypothetical protein